MGLHDLAIAVNAPKFFRTPEALRVWFSKNAQAKSMLWVGFYKKDSGRASITWPESVDEALCVGWIDGIRKRIDDQSYMIRFTPRRPRSIWSATNIARAKALSTEGRMQPAGTQAFAARTENRSGIYSYEQRRAELAEPYANQFHKHKAASAFFEKQPPSYRKMICWWIHSARKEETRQNRLTKLVAACRAGRRL